jgi:hypothetical protein
VNPLDELTALALAQKDLIDRLEEDRAQCHADWVDAHHEYVVAKQKYLKLLKPRWDFVDGKLTRDPNWEAPSGATCEAHQAAIAARGDAMTARHAAEMVDDAALDHARALLHEMRVAWPAALGPFPVPDADRPYPEE